MEMIKNLTLFAFGMIVIWLFDGPAWAIVLGGMITIGWIPSV